MRLAAHHRSRPPDGSTSRRLARPRLEVPAVTVTSSIDAGRGRRHLLATSADCTALSVAPCVRRRRLVDPGTQYPEPAVFGKPFVFGPYLQTSRRSRARPRHHSAGCAHEVSSSRARRPALRSGSPRDLARPQRAGRSDARRTILTAIAPLFPPQSGRRLAPLRRVSSGCFALRDPDRFGIRASQPLCTAGRAARLRRPWRSSSRRLIAAEVPPICPITSHTRGREMGDPTAVSRPVSRVPLRQRSIRRHLSACTQPSPHGASASRGVPPARGFVGRVSVGNLASGTRQTPSSRPSPASCCDGGRPDPTRGYARTRRTTGWWWFAIGGHPQRSGARRRRAAHARPPAPRGLRPGLIGSLPRLLPRASLRRTVHLRTTGSSTRARSLRCHVLVGRDDFTRAVTLPTPSRDPLDT